MPTFQFYRAGSMLDSVTGANLGAVEQKLKALLGSKANTSSSTGYVLGTGARVNQQGGGSVPSVFQEMSLNNPLVFVGLLCLLAYWYSQQQKQQSFMQ